MGKTLGDVKDKIMEILEDEENHSVQSIKESLLSAGYIEDISSATTRNALYLLGKDEKIISESRGTYRKNYEIKYDKYDYDAVMKLADRIKDFDWIGSDDKDLIKARTEAKKLKELKEKLNSISII